MQNLLKPQTEADVSALVAEASATRTSLAVLGSGTKSLVGRPIEVAAHLSTRALSGVTLYEPSEMVMSARAGTLLSDIEIMLSQRRQILPFEPTDLAPMLGLAAGQQTIGGVFATNASGPRRVLAGAARDHFLGVRAVTGSGDLVKSGGRVMKNVTGIDVTRGLAGSWGTLAVMTEVTFKVVPAPAETVSLVLLGLADEIGVEVLAEAMGTPFEVSGAAHIGAELAICLEHPPLRAQGKSITVMRLENAPRSISYRKERLAEALKVYGEMHVLEHDSSQAFWLEMRRLSVFEGGKTPVWRISTSPTAATKVVAALRRYLDCRVVYDWSGGLILAEMPRTSDAGAADVRRVIASHGGHATLIRAEPEVRAIVDVFQPLDQTLAGITQRLKGVFDPAGILNPGRMYPGF